jgi:hypothetical protein
MEQQDMEAAKRAPMQQPPAEPRKRPEIQRGVNKRPEPQHGPHERTEQHQRIEPNKRPAQQTADNPSGSGLPFPINPLNQMNGDEKW